MNNTTLDETVKKHTPFHRKPSAASAFRIPYRTKIRLIKALESATGRVTLPVGTTGTIGVRIRREEDYDVYAFHPDKETPGMWCVTDLHIAYVKGYEPWA